MSGVNAEPPLEELIDLRFLPAWVTQQSKQYADFEGEESPQAFHPRPDRRDRGKGEKQRERGRDRPRQPRRARAEKRFALASPRTHAAPATSAPPPVEVRFLPHGPAFENIAAQLRGGVVAYSLYALARLFLQKPERYDVRLTTKPEQQPIFRLGESSVVSTNHHALEASAFRALRNEYYDTEVTLAEPLKGNFGSVARERTTGILLGPTNYHGYQTQLRRLYEQRFSRRMNFAQFQPQIEIVNDPALLEQWKEEARKVTKFTTRRDDPAQTFSSEAEAERHFREKHLPGLVQETRETEIDGVTSRQLHDRALARLIEDSWAAEVRSPSRMMQELSMRFRNAGLHVFRHREGMLFVSPVRPRPLDDAAALSDSVRTIVETLRASPRIARKELAAKLVGEQSEEARLKLASDLRWLVREGYVVEFNDGSLDLPRVKAQKPTASRANAEEQSELAPALAVASPAETQPA